MDGDDDDDDNGDDDDGDGDDDDDDGAGYGQYILIVEVLGYDEIVQVIAVPNKSYKNNVFYV